MVEKGSTVKLSQYVPQKEGYTFEGWKAGDATYATDADITADADITLTAQWDLTATPAENFVFTPAEDGQSYILSGLVKDFAIADVVVPGTYEDKPVTAIGRSVFSYKNSIRSINLSKCVSLVTIGDWNFASCKNLETVILSGCANLEKIGGSCFLAPTKLKTLKLDGLTKLKEIGSGCFSYCGSPATYIPLEELDLSDCTSLETIGQMSFWYLSDLKVLDLSHTKLTSVGRQFIKECPALEVVVLPATLSLDKIGSEFITDTDNLKEIRVDALSLYLCVEDGVLYDIDKTVLVKAPAKGTLTKYTAPATLKKVLSQAFLNAENLTEIDLTACNLTEIGWQAFAGCRNATLKTAFSKSAKNEDGSTVTLGNKWNYGVKATEYNKVVEITFDGIKNGGTVTSDVVKMSAVAKYGEDECNLTVKLNGETVTGANGKYALPLELGENTIVLTGSYNGKVAEITLRITRVAGNPTVSTNLKNGVISWKGSTVDFIVTAKDAAGNALTSDAIEIWYNFGYTDTKQTEGVTMKDNADGTVSVSVSYDYYWKNWYFDGDQEITLIVTVKDGELSASVSYTVDLREEAPSLTLESTLVDGTECSKNAPLQFTITAKGVSGANLDSSAITLERTIDNYTDKLFTSAFQMTDNEDGTISVVVDLSIYAQWGYIFSGDSVDLLITAKDGNVTKTLKYTVTWM